MIEICAAEFVARTATGEVRVLHPVTATLAESRIAIIGANGSGKSTLARMLNGLIEPTAGSVALTAPDDPGTTFDTVKDGAAVRRLAGFVFTDPAAQVVMPTVIEDVALSLRRSHPDRHARMTAARAVLARFGLADLADRSVHTLSGGQLQLLAITSVLACDPAILIADEPTTLLDLRNTRLITDTLLDLPQQLIVATHDLGFARRCDRVLVIADGRVAFDSLVAGTTAEAAVSFYQEQAS